jgi:hypothetical protein
VTSTVAFATEPGYELFAAWIRRDQRPSLRHMVVGASLVTVCGREVPADADLEALLVKTTHDIDEMLSVCRRCRVTRQMMAAIGTREVMFRCYPTTCGLCQERVLDPGRAS